MPIVESLMLQRIAKICIVQACVDGTWVRQYLILLDQRKLVTFEEGCTPINCIGGASVQLCGLALVDGSVACLLKLRRQEVVKVIALNFLLKTKPD